MEHLGRVIYSDGLILNGYEHYRVYHSYNEFAKNHINSIEWPFAKRRLVKFNGLGDEKFHIHEFRWSNKNLDLYPILLKIQRESPLN